jgi:two-component system, chemotaxis family, chemotaxis protein CheY
VRILMVDDCCATRLIFSALLKEMGFDVVEAADGVEALECLSLAEPDLIITDVNMPRMDGLTFIEQARRTPNGSKARIFVMSSESGPASFQRAATCGVQAWLAKPMDLCQVAASLWAEAFKSHVTNDPGAPANMLLVKAA